MSDEQSNKEIAVVTTKQPNIESAAVTARTISRLLKKSGFQMRMKGECGSAGYSVHRVGVSSTVSVWWRCQNEHWFKPEHKIERRKKLDEVLRFLSDRGYQFDESGYLQCEFD